MSDEPWKEVDTKKARRQYINAISHNHVEAVEVSLLHKLRRWPLANAFVLASLIVPPALFQYSQSAGAKSAQDLVVHNLDVSKLELATRQTIGDAGDLTSVLVGDVVGDEVESERLKSNNPKRLASLLDVAAAVVTTPSQALVEGSDQKLGPVQSGDAQMLVVVYSTLSQAEAISHAHELADSRWIQELAHPRVVQTDSGYYGVVFGQYKPSKAQQIQLSAVQAGVADDAYLMNEKRVERWIES